MLVTREMLWYACHYAIVCTLSVAGNKYYIYPQYFIQFFSFFKNLHSLRFKEIGTVFLPRHGVPRCDKTCDRSSIPSKVHMLKLRLVHFEKAKHSKSATLVIVCHSGHHVLLEYWQDFQVLKEDLLMALRPGNPCLGAIPWIWDNLMHHFGFPLKNIDFWTWCKLWLLHIHNKKSTQVCMKHYQKLINSPLLILQRKDIQCPEFRRLSDVLCDFLHISHDSNTPHCYCYYLCETDLSCY